MDYIIIDECRVFIPMLGVDNIGPFGVCKLAAPASADY